MKGIDMHNQETNQVKLPRELRAVLKIFNYDEELKRKALPYVDMKRQSINWPEIWANDFGGGHSAALLFAQAIWCDRVETKGDPFDLAFAMDRSLQMTVIEALAIRWGLVKEEGGA
jgi:hypothetical protein